mgnify:CR=1 FL=1
MTAADANRAILRALWHRHCEDVAAAEVNVPTATGNGVTSQRMDFLAIAPSWSKPRVICYEVKVDRRDFVHDAKWQAYLKTCHELIFVTKAGVATLAEIPEEAGWQELSANGKVLMTRKKAPRHKLAINVEAGLYKHLLMRIGKKGFVPNREFFEDWLRTKREERVLGRMVGRELAVTVAERLRTMKREVDAANARSEKLEGIRETLKALGIPNPDTWALHQLSYGLERELKRRLHAQQISGALAEVPRLSDDMKALAQNLGRVGDLLRKIDDAAREEAERATSAEEGKEEAA